MMKFLRSQSQTVLVVVLGVIGLGFLFYGNAGQPADDTGGRTSTDFGRIDGEDLTVADLTEAVRNTRDSLIIMASPRIEAARAHRRKWPRKPGVSCCSCARRTVCTSAVSDKELVEYHPEPADFPEGRRLQPRRLSEPDEEVGNYASRPGGFRRGPDREHEGDI